MSILTLPIATIRSVSSWLGAALAVAALALIISVYEGLQTEYRNVLQGPLADSVSVGFASTVLETANLASTRPEGLQFFESSTANPYIQAKDKELVVPPAFTQRDIDALRAQPLVKDVAWVQYESEFGATAQLSVPLWRASSSFFPMNNLTLARGRMPAATDGPDAVVLGYQAAQRLFAERDPVGMVLETDPNATLSSELPAVAWSGKDVPRTPAPPYRFTVVGVLAPTPKNRPDTWLALDSLIFRVSDQVQERTDTLLVLPQPGRQAELIADLQKLFGERNNEQWRLEVRSQQSQYAEHILAQFQRLVAQAFGWILALALLLMTVTLAIGGMLQVAVQVRTLGIQRSLGATRSSIFHSFVRKGLGVGVVGAVVGLVLAWIAKPLAAAAGNTVPVFGPFTIGTALGIALVLGLLASVVPAVRAMRLAPTQALRERAGMQLHRRRWLWGGPGIALSLIVLVLVLALRDGLAARMNQILNWTGQQSVTFVSSARQTEPFTRPAYLTIEDYRAVRDAFPTWQIGWLRDPNYTVVEVSANLAQLRPVTLLCGRWFTAAEEQQGANVLVLARKRAEQLTTQRNPDPCAVKTWRGYPVVGVLDEWNFEYAQGYTPYSAYTPVGSRIIPTLDDPQTLWPWESMPLLSGQLIVNIPSGEDLGAATERIKAFLAARHPEGEPQYILPAGVTQGLLTQRNQILTLAGVMALLCLAIGGIGLMNLTFIAVLSRAREIGVRRALGATRRQIVGQILGETVRLCVGAGLLGAAAGIGIAYVLQQRWGWPQVWHLNLIGVALLTAVATGVVFGALPAWWAATLPPTRAIKTE